MLGTGLPLRNLNKLILLVLLSIKDAIAGVPRVESKLMACHCIVSSGQWQRGN